MKSLKLSSFIKHQLRWQDGHWIDRILFILVFSHGHQKSSLDRENFRWTVELKVHCPRLYTLLLIKNTEELYRTLPFIALGWTKAVFRGERVNNLNSVVYSQDNYFTPNWISNFWWSVKETDTAFKRFSRRCLLVA